MQGHRERWLCQKWCIHARCDDAAKHTAVQQKRLRGPFASTFECVSRQKDVTLLSVCARENIQGASELRDVHVWEGKGGGARWRS